ncbi:heparan sulfate 2-O-sulfotransferase hst-2-like isoform X2 [Apostichopus japonicus]|uniref:heparan sulfate 2-O-sulfotransferase hst-2-like isoform X2 n=1 Tax=Stichopus japonicus TaxID=307972 RepID=UPI003AB3D52E
MCLLSIDLTLDWIELHSLSKGDAKLITYQYHIWYRHIMDGCLQWWSIKLDVNLSQLPVYACDSENPVKTKRRHFVEVGVLFVASCVVLTVFSGSAFITDLGIRASPMAIHFTEKTPPLRGYDSTRELIQDGNLPTAKERVKKVTEMVDHQFDMPVGENQFEGQTDVVKIDRDNVRRSSNNRGTWPNLQKHIENTTENTHVSYFGKVVPFDNYSIIYNAVPKCASRTLHVAITGLRKHNGKGRIYTNVKPTAGCSSDNTANRSCLAHMYGNMRSLSFIRLHVPFIEMPSNFVMINMVRDPMDRWISKYYFQIYGDSTSEMNKTGWRETFDECLANKRTYCDPKYEPGAMKFFCGLDVGCRNLSRWTLDRAKHNLNRYLVVGYREDVESMLRVIELLLPKTTVGIYDQYVKNLNSTRKFQTKKKPAISEETRTTLRRKLALHYEFYNFVRLKFDKLKKDLGLLDQQISR